MVRDLNCILIPTLDEEKTIGKVIDGTPADFDVFIVDGLSTDKTVSIAKEKGAKIIIEKKEGKGNAVKTAFRKLKGKYNKIVMMDGDYTYDPKDVSKFTEKLEECDIVFGKRLINKNSMSSSHRLGNFIITLTANILYNKNISDLCTGYIGFDGKALKKIEISAKGFDLEANIFAQAVKKDLIIGEVPIKYRALISESKLNALPDGIKIIWKLFYEKFSHI